MLRLRPYKSCDAELIARWVNDENIFRMWCGSRIGQYPLSAEDIDRAYTVNNGGCAEQDNFYPWTAIDENDRPVGSFTMRYIGTPRRLRFGWVIADPSVRGKGLGRSMLTLGLKYAFDLLGAESVTIGVFEDNLPAHSCYQRLGFSDTGTTAWEEWNIIEMELLKEDLWLK